MPIGHRTDWRIGQPGQGEGGEDEVMAERRVALITGASKGIGAATAQTLARRGYAVAVNARSKGAHDVAQALREDGHQAQAYLADVSKKAEVEAMVDAVERELGPIWLLVNNAGVLNAAPTWEMAERAWDAAFAVDAKGVFLCSQAALQRMLPRKVGRIMVVGSIAGLIVRTGQIAYSSAKAAAIHFARSLAIEVAPHGITVNCVCPGMTRTELLLESFAQRGLDVDAMVARIPTGRMSEAEDTAAMIAFFASDEAAQITGQVVCVDGGQSQYFPIAQRSKE
jgi:NAD(P)-dependent dehydrogenase (short-subunit alcohol dehydrogenase family)